MEIVILLIVAVAALCCMGSNLVMVFWLVCGKRDKLPQEPEKSREELEREREALEAQRKDLEGMQNILAHTGFAWKNGGKRE